MKKLIVAAMATSLAIGGAGLAQAKPGPNGHNNYGLCKAYFSGSENGQANKRKAPPFAQLESDAAAANQTVAQFCASATPGGK